MSWLCDFCFVELAVSWVEGHDRSICSLVNAFLRSETTEYPNHTNDKHVCNSCVPHCHTLFPVDQTQTKPKKIDNSCVHPSSNAFPFQSNSHQKKQIINSCAHKNDALPFNQSNPKKKENFQKKCCPNHPPYCSYKSACSNLCFQSGGPTLYCSSFLAWSQICCKDSTICAFLFFA